MDIETEIKICRLLLDCNLVGLGVISRVLMNVQDGMSLGRAIDKALNE